MNDVLTPYSQKEANGQDLLLLMNDGERMERYIAHFVLSERTSTTSGTAAADMPYTIGMITSERVLFLSEKVRPGDGGSSGGGSGSSRSGGGGGRGSSSSDSGVAAGGMTNTDLVGGPGSVGTGRMSMTQDLWFDLIVKFDKMHDGVHFVMCRDSPSLGDVLKKVPEASRGLTSLFVGTGDRFTYTAVCSSRRIRDQFFAKLEYAVGRFRRAHEL